MLNNNIDDETDQIANTILILAISVMILAILLTPLLITHKYITIGAISGGMILSFGYYIRFNLKKSQQKESLEEKVSDGEM
jgi:hypothetical protein